MLSVIFFRSDSLPLGWKAVLKTKVRRLLCSPLVGRIVHCLSKTMADEYNPFLGSEDEERHEDGEQSFTHVHDSEVESDPSSAQQNSARSPDRVSFI